MNTFRTYIFHHSPTYIYCKVCKTLLNSRKYYAVDRVSNAMEYGYVCSRKCVTMYILQNM